MYTCIHSGHAEAHWDTDTSTHNKAGTYSLTDDQVIELFNLLIDNIYVHVGSVVFQQATGIPIGYRLCTCDWGSFSFFF